MRSELRSLRERIRQVEAGGHRDTPLRRAYNHKLRALKGLKGGGGDIGIGPPKEIEYDGFKSEYDKKFNHILKNARGFKTSDNRYFEMNQNGELHRYHTNKSGEQGRYKGMDIVWRVPEKQPYNNVSVSIAGIHWDNELIFYSFTGPVYLKSVINEEQVVKTTHKDYLELIDQLQSGFNRVPPADRDKIIKQAPTVLKHIRNLKAWHEILKKYSVSNQLSHGEPSQAETMKSSPGDVHED